MQLVAPAGNYKSLVASICGGADAVYLGMPHFGARAKAANFDITELESAIKYAHTFGVKIFVTLNTLIKDCEMHDALYAAKTAYDLGVDAAIVQDIRFIEKLKKSIPDFTLHASTQMGIHNKAGAITLKNLGIGRAVLSRETLPEDISEIKTTGIEIEYFVHGALCVCFSGNCYFSSLASSYSGNRGKCMQLCRKPYFFHGNRGYFLSAKDICLYDKLEYLKNLGVDAIKIEGRMRSEEYAYRAVSTYKSSMPPDLAVESLKSTFNRGDYCNAYLNDDAPFRVIYPKTQSNIGKFIGKISSVTGSKIVVNGYEPNELDGYKIMRKGYEICGASVKNGKISTDGNCKPGDELRLTFDGHLSQSMKSINRKLDITVDVKICENCYISATLKAATTAVDLISDFIPERALSKSNSVGIRDIEKVFEKVSEYPFDPNIHASIEGNVFIPIAKLNAFRREAYKRLYDAIQMNYKTVRSSIPFTGINYNKFDGHGKILMIENTEQLTDKALSLVDYVAINPRDFKNFSVPQINKPILLNLPPIMRGEDSEVLKYAVNKQGIYGIISNNLYTFSITDKPILLGPLHNIIGKTDMPHIGSFETDKLTGGFEYAFGYAPVMTLCHCPYGKCINCSGNDELIDENGRHFKLRRYNLTRCYWQLLNCVPHNLTNRNESKDLFYDCTTLNKTEIIKVLNGSYVGQYTVGNINKVLK